ncbi:DUF3039 domain-containing protein [Cellulomonas sp. ATA003]|uniref:DUF3039 domain-containing protein n=1 Tax=Cellulomonas sp. ATA003 TaxID=3073064 RepID=UPI002873839E|nr:DUF3039 domain-containing protein [Cellulomonas sp. ATA003]WNB86670.1 DUF3039 domain-containing protein [Cellulomonas sp. ATA003]
MSEPFASTTGPDDPFADQPDTQGSTGTATGVLERTEATPEVEPGDRERFAHYVRKEKILDSALSGKPVIALCGKVWVPGRDPNKFPVCPICQEIYNGLRPPQDGEGGDGGSGGGTGSGSGSGFRGK